VSPVTPVTRGVGKNPRRFLVVSYIKTRGDSGDSGDNVEVAAEFLSPVKNGVVPER
jgi:hypothetical protein